MAKKVTKKKPKRIDPRPRVKAELQKEIGSRCPFCPSEDVGHFEFHHIDKNRSNTVAKNLLMLCRQCHSKFTKREWPLKEAQAKKAELLRDIDYKYFESENDSFDYICHDMKQSNGRLPEDNGNGSVARVKVKDRYHFIIELKQSDGRIWKGELVLEQRDYGKIFYRYQADTEFEFGRKECYLKQIITPKLREDVLFLKPLTNVKDYGDEIIRRRTSLK